MKSKKQKKRKGQYSRNVKYALGFDLGGTKLALGLMDSDGNLSDQQRASVLDLKSFESQEKGVNTLMDLMGNMIRDFQIRYPDAFRKRNFCGVGLASAGPLNVDSGCLIHPVNFPNWKLVKIIRRLNLFLKKNKLILNPNVRFQNDAVAAALAEEWLGGAKSLNSFALITVGTGIGTGVILNGHPVQSKGMGSEFGHLIVKDPWTVEQLASGTGIVRRAREELRFNGNSVEELLKFENHLYIEHQKSRTLDLEIKNREFDIQEKYEKIWNDSSHALALLCYNLSIGFHLDAIFFSGGLMSQKEKFFPLMKKEYSTFIQGFNSFYACPIRESKLKNNVGIIGACRLVF